MLKADKADLNGDYDLAIAHCDWKLPFGGYSIDPVPRGDDLIHLVKA
jgi:hypothetical protein